MIPASVIEEGEVYVQTGYNPSSGTWLVACMQSGRHFMLMGNVLTSARGMAE